MDPHDLAEKTTGLASRVNNLAVQTTGNESRQLLEQQDNLTKLAMAAIVKDLDAGQGDYKNAVSILAKAITQVETACSKATEVANAINLVGQAIGAVAKAVA